MAIAFFRAADKIGVEPSIEVHRDVCTETPEKTYALAEEFVKATGRAPAAPGISRISPWSNTSSTPVTFPRGCSRTLLSSSAREQLHCRPFNGHHAQVPVTDGKGRLTPEVKDYLVFVEDLFRLWLKGNQDGTRSLRRT